MGTHCSFIRGKCQECYCQEGWMVIAHLILSETASFPERLSYLCSHTVDARPCARTLTRARRCLCPWRAEASRRSPWARPDVRAAEHVGGVADICTPSGEVCVHVCPPFSNCIACFFAILVGFKSSLYVLDASSLLDILFAYIFPVCSLSVYILHLSFQKELFLILMRLVYQFSLL